jgi:geranylgeranyl diphosphate synthase type I
MSTASVGELLELADLGVRVESRLTRFIEGRRVAEPSPRPGRSLVGPVRELLLGPGKRLRAAFCYWGWRGAGGDDSAGVIAAAAALELLHGFALIHDDVMDESAVRRGRPTVHRFFAERHAEADRYGSAGQFGTSAAILAGDLCLVWADMLLRESGLPTVSLNRAASVYDAMREETIHGQYLDLVTQTERSPRTGDAWEVARGKTAASTTTGPLAFGAALAGADAELTRAYAIYADSLGIAFQLRDDLLGAFGDPALTGKPSGDDLRDGKCTVLLAHARRTARPHVRRRIDELLGHASDDPRYDVDEVVDELRVLVDSTDARDHVEWLVAELGRRAVAALDTVALAGQARHVLVGLADALTDRAQIDAVLRAPTIDAPVNR